MRLLYAINSCNNSLYEGKFELNGRYRTYGQHSYILDLASCARRLGIDLDFAVRGLPMFPLAAPLARLCRVVDFDRHGLEHRAYDACLIDEVADDMVDRPGCRPALCVVHNARRVYSPRFAERMDVFICMSPSSLRRQSLHIPASKLALVPQGVDLDRFQPRRPCGRSSEPPSVLIYSRLDGLKAAMVAAVIERVAASGADLTVLGDGEAFWPISDQLGARITLTNFIPCHSIQNFIPRFDVVISSGRGVMEALACGIPAICAGLGYGGLVTPENLERLMEANLTGYGAGEPPEDMRPELERALAVPPADCREMAESRLDMTDHVSSVIDLVRKVSPR